MRRGPATLLGPRNCRQTCGPVSYLGDFLNDAKITRIINGLSVTPGGDQLVFAQLTQMLRQSTFTKFDSRSQFAHRNFTFCQKAQNQKSPLIAEKRQKCSHRLCKGNEPPRIQRVRLQSVDTMHSPDGNFFAIVLHSTWPVSGQAPTLVLERVAWTR
jgi:hypothetical protein